MFLIFSGFTLIMLIVIWGVQLSFWEDIYASIKTRAIEKNVGVIAQNVTNEDLQTLIDNVVYSEEICVTIVDSSGNAIKRGEYLDDCIIHNVSADKLADYYRQAEKSGGSYSYSIPRPNMDDNYDSSNFNGDAPDADMSEIYSFVYVKIAETDGVSYAVIGEGTITPISTTTSTIFAQFSIVSILFILISLGVSYYLSKVVAEPIIKLNVSAKELAKGTTEINFEGDGYKEIIELKETLNYASREIAEVEHYRRELLANVSHDLRTPLTLIKGYTEMMRDLPSEATAENFEVVIGEAERLTNLVSDMLDITKLQEGGNRLSLAEFDLVASINALVARHGKLIERLGYTLVWESEEKGFVFADETKILQVVYNLINNAVNYAGADNTVIVKEFTRGENVRIEVTDHGEGVDVEILPHIWDRYYKSDKAHRRASVGTGLGLSIVKNVMELHPGGVYGVITSAGEGSTFYIELPKLKG